MEGVEHLQSKRPRLIVRKSESGLAVIEAFVVLQTKILLCTLKSTRVEPIQAVSERQVAL